MNLAVPMPDDARLKALAVRDAAFDGVFVYGVTSTGIYCRPSCPSRRPKPGNVRLFDDGAAAAAAGFRPCLRCRPDEGMGAGQGALAVAACRRIEAMETPPPLAELARDAGLSVSYFQRLFRRIIGVTPREYAQSVRARRTREALASAPSVTAALYDAGFNSSGRFYEAADGILGMTPGQYRAGGRDADIAFAIARTSLGALLVARSERGVCSISLGDDPDALVGELRRRFANARLSANDAVFDGWVAAVVAQVEGQGGGSDLPLDVRGTAFQQRVWQALRDIPAGETATYAEVARRIGAPAAVRAVAGACAANNLAILIPCHRVVRSDGSLSGYRWGVARKRALLQREAKT